MNIIDFQRIYKDHNPCEEGVVKFDACRNRKEAFELLCQPQFTDFVMQSIQEGWGPSIDDIETNFASYLNGRLTVNYRIGERKVYSEVWCRATDLRVNTNVRCLILFGCKGRIEIKDWQAMKIICDKNCNLQIDAPRNSMIYIQNFGGRVEDINKTCRFYAPKTK